MKYVFVGDIHGRTEHVKKALSMDGHKVFVGDFVDSFDRTTADMRDCLSLVLDAVEKGEATALLGNHEQSYLMPAVHRCSGYTVGTDQMIREFAPRIAKSFKSYFKPAEDWLVTHAGLHPIVNAATKGPWETEAKNPRSPLNWIGQYRGGRHEVGGIFWCDFNSEFEPIENLNQIFGHSSAKGMHIRSLAGKNSVNYCVDCLSREQAFLELDL